MTAKKEFTITVYMQDRIGLINRVNIIFSRRRINIESLHASSSEISGIKKIVFVISEVEETVKKIIRQIEKQIDVLQVHHYMSPVVSVMENEQ